MKVEKLLSKIEEQGNALLFIYDIFTLIEEDGNIMILKVDGAREDYKYNCIITSPKQEFLPIRTEEREMAIAIKKALELY